MEAITESAAAQEPFGGPGYLLLTTPRLQDALAPVVEAAGELHHVPGGLVPELAAAALPAARGHDRVVALGGGRVVDVAKAVAAALGVRAMAIPTTLSGAEMTRGHRHAAGIAEDTPRVRCAVVVHDPALAASQPVDALAASAGEVDATTFPFGGVSLAGSSGSHYRRPKPRLLSDAAARPCLRFRR